MHVAESSFFIFVTHFLAVFTVSNPVDERGQKLTSPGPSTDAHISYVDILNRRVVPLEPHVVL